jgi:hypothetical protein
MEELESQEKIGEFLVRIGAITGEQVAEILKIQEQDSRKLFGMIAIEKGFIDDAAVMAYLNAKRKAH